MSIPFYFAMEENETAPLTGKQYAQLGFGFFEDGRLRLPVRTIPNAAAVINDRFLPEKAPGPEVLDRLAQACKNGCFLDFERPVNEISAAIAVGLQQRLCEKITVPPALRHLCPGAFVQISIQLCNDWENAMKRMQKQYRDQWVLEIIPWCVSIKTGIKQPQSGYLPAAECNYHAENGIIRYYDTEESIHKKLAIAEKYGCQAGIALLQEYVHLKD